MKKGFSGNRKYIIFAYFNCTHGRLGLNVHLTMGHIKLELRVSQNLVRLKEKGRQKKNQTNKQGNKATTKRKKTMLRLEAGK